MFIPVSVSCLIVVCRLRDRNNNFYFHLLLAAWNQLITLIIMNFKIYNNTIFNIGLAKLDIMNNAIHMTCRAQFNDQRCLWSISSLVLSLQCGVLIIISNIGKNIRYILSVSYRIHFQWSIGVDIGNTFYGEYRYRQYLFKVALITLITCY